MNKPSKFILLPTDKSSNLLIVTTDRMNYRGRIAGHLELHDSSWTKSDDFTPQHLYILSPEPHTDIRVGDWVYDSIPDEDEYAVFRVDSIVEKSGLCRSKTFSTTLDSCKKIIATTNPDLHTDLPDEGIKGANYDYGVPEISQSDIQDIISLYNGTATPAYVEKLADEYRRKHPGGNVEHRLAFEDGYNQCLKDNEGKWFSLDFIKGCLSFFTDQAPASYIKREIVKSLTKERPKPDTVMVEYEEIAKELTHGGIEHEWKLKIKDGCIVISKI